MSLATDEMRTLEHTEDEAPVRAAIARLPVGEPFSAQEAADYAAAKAAKAAGVRGVSTEEVLAKARARFGV
jgi:hypothetical protein